MVDHHLSPWGTGEECVGGFAAFPFVDGAPPRENNPLSGKYTVVKYCKCASCVPLFLDLCPHSLINMKVAVVISIVIALLL